MFFRGQIIGKYKILSTIGSGGFGTVYLAEDTWIDKKVALKVPHKQNLDFGELLREPRLLATLNHPNIVTILTAEKQENVFFIVMEFVPGETLESIIARDGALDLPRALDYTCQICNAVDHAHRQGVLHRDLRPSNVLVTDNGLVKVADFGTSRFLEIAAHGTTVIGSPPYMAPEQFQGKAVFASDIYSLGVTMYQMLTGVLPYDTPSPADLDRLMRGELLTAPRLKNPKIPKAINDIVLKAMAPEITRALPARRRAARRRAGGPRRQRAPDAAAAAGGDASSDVAGDPDAPQGAGSAAAALLLALPQAAARAIGPLSLLRRSTVKYRREERTWHLRAPGKIWMNGSLVDWADAKIHIASHVIHYGSGVFEGARCYATPKGIGLLPARRARRAPPQLGQDLPDGHAAHARDARGRHPRHHPRQRVQGVLHPADHLSRVRHARRQPVPLPRRRGDHALGMGRVPRRRRAREGRRRQGQLVDAHGAQHVPVARQEQRQLRQLRR